MKKTGVAVFLKKLLCDAQSLCHDIPTY